MGKIHLQQWLTIDEVALVGFYEPNDEVAEAAAALYKVPRYATLEGLLAACDAVDIVTPTIHHHLLAKTALLMGKHLFIEKPLTNTLAEAQELIKLVKEANVKCQVGHVERFNPALLALGNRALQPMFIECHRLATFNPRGTDVSVILDLMIHDIDIVLHLVKSPVKRISASGVAVMSETPDIANARIEFDNGCVANLTASRISLKKMRKSRFFQKDAYIAVDMLKKETEIMRMRTVETPDPFAVTMDLGPGKGHREISFDKPAVPATNAIREELRAFGRCIAQGTEPEVPAADGLAALELAHRVLASMGTRVL